MPSYEEASTNKNTLWTIIALTRRWPKHTCAHTQLFIHAFSMQMGIIIFTCWDKRFSQHLTSSGWLYLEVYGNELNLFASLLSRPNVVFAKTWNQYSDERGKLI